VRHERHYTLEEANAALPEVAELIERLRAARDSLGDRAARDALAEATPTNGGGEPARTVAEGFLGVREGLLELQEREIVLRDLDRGLVDFPSMRDDSEIYLCWEEGEDHIGFWHEPDAGFSGRQPLDG
jgi:hypothetical protein